MINFFCQIQGSSTGLFTNVGDIFNAKFEAKKETSTQAKLIANKSIYPNY